MSRSIDAVKKEERLWIGFQFLVDADARIHHIDLDRVASKTGRIRSGAPTAGAATNCFDHIQRNFDKVLGRGPKKKKETRTRLASGDEGHQAGQTTEAAKLRA